MINPDDYEGHTPAPWLWYEDEEPYTSLDLVVADDQCRTVIEEVKALNTKADARLIADAPLILEAYKRLQSEPTVTVDDYHKKGHLYVTVRFPDGDEYVGLVEKWEGEEE